MYNTMDNIMDNILQFFKMDKSDIFFKKRIYGNIDNKISNITNITNKKINKMRYCNIYKCSFFTSCGTR